MRKLLALFQGPSLAMGLLLWVCATALGSLTARAQNVTGLWRAPSTEDDGKKVETFFFLTQHGDKITGAIHLPWGEAPIHTGTMQGGEFDLRLSEEEGGLRYTGHLASGKLEITFFHSKGRTTPLVGVPATIADMKLTPHDKLPALHKVPSNGLARTPPMGWNSWNFFKDKIDDKTVREVADVMVSSGMRDAGYAYINIDDTWEGKRDAAGNLQPNNKFPDMKAMADYVHSRGLKLGIYSSPGEKTCAGFTGSFGHEEQDAKQFAAWGIDYLKYDWCTASHIYLPNETRAVYQIMGNALHHSGRAIVYSFCQYGLDDVWKWGPDAGANLWRTTGDISPRFTSMYANATSQESIAPYAVPGHWNDPDMLEVGNPGMSAEESKSHMSLWALIAAPLIAGNDVRHMTADTKDILMNKEIIAVDQDALGKQARRVLRDGDLEVWVRPLADGSSAVGFFNIGLKPIDMSVEWKKLGLQSPRQIHDLWSHHDVPSSDSGYAVHLKAHSADMLRAR